MQPDHFRIPLKPGELALGILTRMLLQQANGFLPIVLPFDKIKDLPVAHRLQGVVTTKRIKRCRLIKETVFNHPVHSQVDAIIEFLPGQVQADLDNAEVVRPALALLKTGDRLARAHYHLKGAHKALWVARIDL